MANDSLYFILIMLKKRVAKYAKQKQQGWFLLDTHESSALRFPVFLGLTNPLDSFSLKPLLPVIRAAICKQNVRKCSINLLSVILKQPTYYRSFWNRSLIFILLDWFLFFWIWTFQLTQKSVSSNRPLFNILKPKQMVAQGINQDFLSPGTCF